MEESQDDGKKKYKTSKRVDADEQMRVMQMGEYAEFKDKNDKNKKSMEENIKNRDVSMRGGKFSTLQDDQ